MRTRFDQFSKHVVEGGLGSSCEVKTELEVTAEVQKIDAYVVPEIARSATREKAGLLGRMAERPCLIEAFYNPPGLAQVRDCLHKQLALHGRQRREARRAKRSSPALPLLWVVAGGDPVRVRRGFRLRALPGWPSGCYRGPSALGLRVVLPAELPRERSTLLVRLMGARATLHEALNELRGLPGGAWERSATGLWLEALHLTLVSGEADLLDEEIAMDVHQAYEESQRRAREQGHEEGRLDELLRLLARRVGRSIGSREEASVRKRVQEKGREALEEALFAADPAVLTSWLDGTG